MADTPKRARFYEKRRVEGRKPAKSIAIEVEKGHEARLTNLMDSWRKARDGFVVKGDTKTGNADFLEHLLDMYRKSHETDGLTLLANVANTPRPTAHPNFAKNLHTAANHEDELFITTKSCLSTMLAELGACPALKGDRGDTCGGELSIKEMDRYGHVIVATITCPKKHTWKWHSSSSVGGKYYVNQRVVHAFTSTGMAPVKYETFCEAAKLGVNGEAYVKNSLRVVEGAHDNLQVINKLYKDKGMKNSNDTWHATKKVAKDMRKIATGAQRDMGKTWHPELQDKCASTKTGIYWAMKTCEGSADKIRATILNMVNHYMNTNVLRDTYCVKHYQDIRRPSRIAPMRVLKPKDTSFRDNIWRDFYNLHY
ncbi:uncharacterized protein LOC144927455 isoform X3 [Branchiostoma floridae x Branchiostoma belcheri]